MLRREGQREGRMKGGRERSNEGGREVMREGWRGSEGRKAGRKERGKMR